jgi:vacuolar-type H+-ATPase subunit I/STV1
MSIVSMKKVSLFAPANCVKQTLRSLYNVGVLHVIPMLEKSKNITSELKYINHLLTATDAINCYANRDTIKSCVRFKHVEDINTCLPLIFDCIIKKKRVASNICILKKKIYMLNKYANFDASTIKYVENKIKKNVLIIECKKKVWEKDKKQFFFEQISETEESVRMLIITDQKKNNFNIISSFKYSLNLLNKKLSYREKRLERINKFLDSINSIKHEINTKKENLISLKTILNVESISYNKNNLFAVQGYIPKSQVDLVVNLFHKSKVAFNITTPSPSDRVPVKFNNNALFSGFEVIVKMFSGMSYHEKDVTSIVGCLFIWFGALCFMDGGYGLLLFLLGIALFQKEQRQYGAVFIFTGLFTIIFGLLNGQIFGLIVGDHILKNHRPLMMLSTDPFMCLTFSLVIGILNIFFSSITAIWQRGYQTDANGRLCLVIACMLYAFKTHYVINILVQDLMFYVFLILSLFYWIKYPEITFEEEQKLANIVWTIYNGVVGLIQDTLSHMRLFGISLSGAILALVVNEISCLFPIYLQVPFCIAGHIFVFGLSLLSLGVHTNRLIFLEFGSKCIEGGDYYYLPLGRS